MKATRAGSLSSCRPPTGARCFSSAAIEEAIEEVSRGIRDRELAWLFGNCFPNTLDTTVTFARDADGKPDTFVITGDIDAMWLRDSTNQVWPYIPFVVRDAQLNALVQGVINRQARCVRQDPYANAFYADPTKVSPWQADQTAMQPGIHERKYELDSLCAFLRLSCGYWAVAKDQTCFDAGWLEAVTRALQVMRREQAGTDEGLAPAYTFRRTSDLPTETLALNGEGQPARRCGLSRSPFRPSDDAAMLPFLVPANAMAVVCLRQLASLLAELGLAPALAAEATTLAAEIDAGIQQQARVQHPTRGGIYAFEVDGFGAHYLMDDANVPSLLSLPYLGYCAKDEAWYQRTRGFILSADNPYYSAGQAGRGVGGPHVGPGWIWPMAITMQALTSTSDDEIVTCLRQLRATHAGTGFMHETFWKDDASRFTRAWFAWANTLFGELIVTLHRERPAVLDARLD